MLIRVAVIGAGADRVSHNTASQITRRTIAGQPSFVHTARATIPRGEALDHILFVLFCKSQKTLRELGCFVLYSATQTATG